MTKEDLEDIINVAIEELVRNRYELPGFPTLHDAAQNARTEISTTIYAQITNGLQPGQLSAFGEILTADESKNRSPWQNIKEDPGRATQSNFRRLVEHIEWLEKQNTGSKALDAIPDTKVKHFASEAKSLDVARMRRIEPQKRYALVASLVKVHHTRSLDDIGDMFVKRIAKIHFKGREALEAQD